MESPSPVQEEIAGRLARVRERIRHACAAARRDPATVTLVAVSKTQPAAAIAGAVAAGQLHFGENYLQEALAKRAGLAPGPVWHFIGPIQSNKTRDLAAGFDWVHGVDRLKVAQRLSEQRPAGRPPLQVCLQVNISAEATKSGVMPAQAAALAAHIAPLRGLRLRGLMAIPAPGDGEAFERLRRLQEQLCAQGLALDTLSMGMSDDFEAAIAAGATLVRVGSAIFGARA